MIQRVFGSDLDERLAAAGLPGHHVGERDIALIDDADETSFFLIQLAYEEPETNPPDEARRYYVAYAFYPSAGNVAAFVKRGCEELRDMGEGDTAVRWKVNDRPSLERAVDRLLGPRVLASGQREYTAREGLARLR